MCYEDYIFQEIIDGVYEGDTQTVMEHLETCESCHKKYTTLKNQESMILDALNIGIEENINPKEEVSAVSVISFEPAQMKRRKTMNKYMKRFSALAAAIAIVASVIFIEPINAKASDLLQLFRMNELNTVSITDQDIQEISRVLEEGKGEVEIEDFMNVTAREIGESESKYDLADNELLDSFSDMFILPLDENSNYDYYDYSQGVDIELSIHVDKANDFLDYIGEDAELPMELDQEPFNIYIGKSLNYGIGYEDENYIHVMQTEFPEIEIPDSVNEQDLLDILFSLNLLPNSIKDQLMNMNNLTSTAPIPVMTDEQVMEEIMINDSKGILIHNTDGNENYQLYFTYGNMLVNIYTDVELEHIIELAREIN